MLSAAAALYCGWTWWIDAKGRQTTDNAYVHAEITAISAKISGYVVSVGVDDNDVVEEGAILARIDDTDYRAQVDRARAAVAQADAAAANLKRRQEHQLALIQSADAAVQAARADAELAKRELARASQLAGQGWTSQRNFDVAEANEQRASAALTTAEAGAGAARRQLDVIESEATQIAARRQEAEANLRLAEIALADTVIRAPVAGVVGNRKLRSGEYVRPGMMLMSLVPTSSVWVVANFKETQLARMKVGQAASITVDGYPDVSVRGRVDSLAPGSGAAFSLLPPDNATGNFVKIVQRVPVKILLESNHPLVGRLVPGLSVEVSVDLTGDHASSSNGTTKELETSYLKVQ
jgi:membrane fusion protein (multidrug efflux system)